MKNEVQDLTKHLMVFCDQLQSTTKRTEKMQILMDNVATGDLHPYPSFRKHASQFLKFVFDPFIVTGISQQKFTHLIEDIDVINATEQISSWDELYKYLTTHNSGKNSDLASVKTFLNMHENNAGTQYFLQQVITKNLQLGIDVKTINKVLGQTVGKTFEVQLANKYQDKKAKLSGDITITKKIDGIRLIIIKNGDKIICFNRSGIQVEGLIEIESELILLRWNGVLDGELYAIGDFDSTQGYKETTKRARVKGTKTGLSFLGFDHLSSSEFENQTGVIPYVERRKTLEDIFKGHSPYLKCVPILAQGVLNEEQIIEICKEQVAQGEEGVMINVNNAVYQFKRCDTLLKVKLFNDIDLKVVGVQEGTNKYVGKLGALTLEYKGNTVDCGSGFTDKQRTDFWNIKDKLINETVTIKFFEETSNAQGGKSLRFPIFKRFRDLKVDPV